MWARGTTTGWSYAARRATLALHHVPPSLDCSLHQRVRPPWVPNDVIALAVRWYVRYRLSYADVVECFAERGLMVDRSTICRWVQRFLPLFAQAAFQQLLLPVRCDKLYPLVCRFAPTFGVGVAGCVFRGSVGMW